MKIRVVEQFIDKITKDVHNVGEVIDLADAERVSDLVSRKLVVELEEKKPTRSRKK